MTRLYEPDRLYEEVAFVAYHFGWDHETVLTMPHWERQQWCERISSINEQRNREGGADGGGMRETPGGGIELRNPQP